MAQKASLLLSTKKALSTINQAGFTVVEIIVATAIFALIIPSLVTMLWSVQISITENVHSREALELARVTIDQLRSPNIKFNDIHTYVQNDPFYQTTITINWRNLYTKEVTVTVSWSGSSLHKRQLSLTTLLTDTVTARTGSTCLAKPGSGSMRLESSVDLGAGNEATGVVARNHLAYVTTNASSNSTDDFFIIDITDTAHPAIIAALNTGPGLSSLAIAGNYVFVGNTSVNGQLQIIDVSNPTAPFVKKTYKLPGNYTDNTTVANAITYDGQKIFLGTQKSQIAELHEIDVSDINTPKELGSFEINAGINSIAIKDTLAYIASPASEEIEIINLNDPANLHQVGQFDAPGGSGNGKSLELLGGTSLFLGRTIGGQELYALDLDDPVSPRQLDARDLNTSINALAATPDWLFLGATDAAKAIQLWSIGDPVNLSLAKSLSLTDKVTGLACGVDKLYATSAYALLIISP